MVVYDILRYAVFGVVTWCGAMAAADWALRTHRLSPFSRLGRMLRKPSEATIAPVQRQVARAGGNPQNAGWWLVVGALVLSLVFLALVQWIVGAWFTLGFAAQRGPVGIFILVVEWTYRLLILALFIRVIGSWIGMSPYSKWARPVYVATEWLLRPLRRYVPPLGMIDITPFIAYFILWFARQLILGIVL